MMYGNISIDILSIISKLAWAAIPVILMVGINRYFKYKDAESAKKEAAEQAAKIQTEAIKTELQTLNKQVSAGIKEQQQIAVKMKETGQKIERLFYKINQHDLIIERICTVLEIDKSRLHEGKI